VGGVWRRLGAQTAVGLCESRLQTKLKLAIVTASAASDSSAAVKVMNYSMSALPGLCLWTERGGKNRDTSEEAV